MDMTRFPSAAIRLIALSVALAGIAPGLARAGSQPMQFHVEPLQSAQCGARCPNVVVADGVIEPDTPEVFADFARSAARMPNMKSLMLINSPGGNVVASMDFGLLLRQLHMAAVVASYGTDGVSAGPTPGECVSACVYALMGAVRRVAPQQSRVALHRMSVSESQAPTRGHTGATSRRFADERLVDRVASYARKMGVSPDVVLQAESLNPDHIRALSAREMQHWRLASPRL
ncbi:MAG: hypothetical protein KGM15_00940 [Pseudomonadota bacterium]|nr:hypothetical protein [Pseudomonadota bacterium]